ncbi:MAG: polysaccharide biosynthesis/export family protein [Chitinophagaceae bacterium]|nr:polysaccharide biosynthesis/export family protein [Chitinophagaceae bacterium]
MHKFISGLILIIIIQFSACKPVQELPQYLQRQYDTTFKKTVHQPELRFQKYDLLNIQILSLSHYPTLSDSLYNQPGPFMVDENGYIVHHRLGLIKAEGLTKKQLAAEIKKRLTEPVELLKNPTITINLVNFKVTVLGQVGKEGVIQVPGENVNIFEAIGMAGGITEYGRKEQVKIIRETDGIRQTGIVDLTSDSVFYSPFYHLKQNDLILVASTNQKLKEAEQMKNFQKASILLSMVTAAATLISIIRLF